MTLAVDIVSWACLLAGSAFCIIGAVGLLRMPDFWTRTHAAGITDTMGVGLILVGLIFQAGFGLVSVKLLMILLLLYVAGPTSGHAIFRAANAYGIPFSDSTLGVTVSEEDTDDAD